MSLLDDGTAKKSHVPNPGKWEVINGEARVIWSEGWRHLRRDVNGYRKIAFGPGKDFDSEASNTDTAHKAEEKLTSNRSSFQPLQTE